jgi:tRNA modification GTPase
MTELDTIFALSSGHGRAGVAVVRVSGPQAAEAFKVFGVCCPSPRLALVRSLRDAAAGIIDQALCLWLPGPSTATGEDMVELHLHGSPAVIDVVLRQLGQQVGFRIAERGEFTRRAFFNNKLDLLQVEGLSDLLASDSEPQRRLAMRQFLGESSSIFDGWRNRLLSALALAEAAIDFSDEADVAEKAWRQSLPVVETLLAELNIALGQADRVAAVRRGLSVVIAGPPNVGKSSLLNRLASRDAAIVSPIAGTTRDVVEAAMMIGGVQVLLADTAGLRSDSVDEIENEGMTRTRNRLETADVVLWVEDGRSALHAAELGNHSDLKIANKSDQTSEEDSIHLRNDGWYLVSAKTGEGIEALLQSLSELIRLRVSVGEHDVVVRERHRLAVQKAISHLDLALTRSEDTLEFAAEDMRKAAQCLAGVTGRIDVEDVLGKIFQDFCIGK